MKKMTIAGRPLFNANGDVDVTSTGFKYLIDTLSYIRSQIVDQKFYEVNVADYVPVDVGEAAWSDEIVQNLSFEIAGGFHDGDVDTMSGNGRIAAVDAAMSPIRMPVVTWAKAANWTMMEIAKAASAGNWNVVEQKLKTLKTNWDLGIQRVAFLGHPSKSEVSGLLNNPEVNVDTSLITTPISSMDATQFNAFVAGLLAAYFTNSNDTALPNRFVMPTSDYLGLTTFAPVSGGVAQISRLEFLRNAFRMATNDPSFEILPLAYAQSTRSDGVLSTNRYVLYRDNPDTLSMSIPVDFTMLEADTSNRMMFQQPAYGQYSGVLVNRVREVFYVDETPA